MAETIAARREALSRLRQLGGALSLDFVNTIDPRYGPRAHDFFCDYTDFVLWAADMNAVDNAVAARLLKVAGEAVDDAGAVFADVVSARERLYRVLVAAIAGSSPEADDLRGLQVALRVASSHRLLEPKPGGYGWSWQDDQHLECPLWPVLIDAAELLTTSDLARVKMCPGRDCGWLFLDRSKNRSRRWCSMDICGSRDKMRRLHARRRSAPS
jgi:predicted RNA-binding Zn ribbon-like protein